MRRSKSRPQHTGRGRWSPFTVDFQAPGERPMPGTADATRSLKWRAYHGERPVSPLCFASGRRKTNDGAIDRRAERQKRRVHTPKKQAPDTITFRRRRGVAMWPERLLRPPSRVRTWRPTRVRKRPEGERVLGAPLIRLNFGSRAEGREALEDTRIRQQLLPSGSHAASCRLLDHRARVQL